MGLALVGAGFFVACGTSKPSDRVHVLTWKGEVNPVMERYVDRGIDTAEKSNARAVVLQLDTPGGLSTSMHEIVKRIMNAKVPVIVYVSPSGGRAASAGTFITMAGHVAAMAPSTNIGAATPINSDGGDIPGALGKKVTNDAVASIRGIAERRGRNADWAERAVRDAASVNENEAVSLNVVDFVARDLQDLLAKSDGRKVEVAGPGGENPIALRTAGAATVENNPSFFEEFLNVIAEPNIAFMLLTIGSLAILAEIFHPSIAMGIVGVICLVLAFLSLGSLPTNWAGVALILFGFVLLGAEVFVAGFGALGIGGVVALIFGGIILMQGSEVGFQVSRWLIVGLAVTMGAFVVFVIGAIVRIRRTPARTADEFIGSTAEARTKLDPSGYVYLRGERWEAVAEDPPIPEGALVVVTETSGLRLKVRLEGAPPPAETPEEPPPAVAATTEAKL